MDNPKNGSGQGMGHAALRRGRVSLPGRVYHVTTTTAGRRRLFVNVALARVASRSFEQTCLLGTARMLAWVLMPDHVHWLLRLGDGANLSALVARLKSASARNVNHVRASDDAVWSRGFHDHALRREEELAGTARYIVANPLRAGLVKGIGDYPFWNTQWLPALDDPVLFP
ncbi:MAG TPA: transposase [Rhodanobacteraceae bacterium]|nr:transposase [Rhodanobacteraceae bacterium]